MRKILPPWSVLLLHFVASAALASEREKLSVRPILISEHPDDETHRIYVKGQVVTTLRFDRPVEPENTKMIGWEGRLEPLSVVRNKVILEPLHDLNADEAIPLVVRLVDGTEVPFLLRPPGRDEWARTDQQVDIFEDQESHAALRAALTQALKRNGALTEENERYRKEETSEDHALAALLASGAVAQTPFMIADHFSGKDDDAEVDATVFQGKGKAAVVFTVKNLHAENAWSVQRVRLVTKDSSHDRAIAVRATAREITSGGSGRVALVADGSAFVDDGMLTSLWLELYRHDGLRQAFVQLDPALIAR
ncbi:DUF2381 family protein [Stigmatella sp. ncwal1]|uniref:DUF2381 family protein n=1 Tax=Stigmatella ashevillensis TaxID=2995309 RepID=A0ABT5DI61_9BACT|nr:DUF2381 family protein [Stigmatella ashevillena]MDC0712022.1 DUF2381 family protein [Stigmatella ashevillena]